jgi:hypothetical protein
MGGADDLLARHSSPNHIPIHAAKNCNGSGNSFSAVAVFAVRPIRPFYASRSGL